MRRARRWMLGGFLGGLSGFGLLALNATLDGPLHGLDERVNGAVQRLAATGFPTREAGRILSMPGDWWLVGLLTVAATAWMLWRRQPVLAAWCAGIVLTNGVVDRLLKELFQRQRPELVTAVAHGYSFPSGHTLAAAASLGALIILATEVHDRHARPPRRRIPVLYTYALAAWASVSLLTAAGRVLAQAHWLTDVLASWCLGVALVSGILLALTKNARGGDPGPFVPPSPTEPWPPRP